MASNKYDHFQISGDGFIIIKMERTYTRTASGKNWKKNPDSETVTIITGQEYSNYVQSVPFFAHWGKGASCRAYSGCTYAGYIPVHIVTVGPYAENKRSTWFRFEFAR